MKIAVDGVNGALGSILVSMGYEPLRYDVTNVDSVRKEIDRVKPDLIIHCAGKSKPAWCEEHQEEALAINVCGLVNVHRAFGDDVLLVSTDQVFDGNRSTYKEKDKQDPVNHYGFTKLAAEAISETWGGKIIRISRSISAENDDISAYLMELYKGHRIVVPSFIYRNYIHKFHAADGIRFFAENYKKMPQKVHYGGIDTVSFYDLMLTISNRLHISPELVTYRTKDNNETPRPKRGGFSVKLSAKLGFPQYSLVDAVNRLAQEINEN